MTFDELLKQLDSLHTPSRHNTDKVNSIIRAIRANELGTDRLVNYVLAQPTTDKKVEVGVMILKALNPKRDYKAKCDNLIKRIREQGRDVIIPKNPPYNKEGVTILKGFLEQVCKEKAVEYQKEKKEREKEVEANAKVYSNDQVYIDRIRHAIRNCTVGTLKGVLAGSKLFMSKTAYDKVVAEIVKDLQ